MVLPPLEVVLQLLRGLRFLKRALGFLLGRFSGRVLKTGEHIVPAAALEALAAQNISFTVQGTSTYEQQMAAIRGSASSAIQ